MSLDDFIAELRAVAGMIEMGERISWGRDVALMREAAVRLEKWKGIADTRLERAEINHAAYLNLLNDTQS